MLFEIYATSSYEEKKAQDVLVALKSRIATEGSPVVIQTDNGLEFNNETLKSFLNEKKIKFKRGRPRHPQNQGQVERANQTLTRKLAKCLSTAETKRWMDVLDDIVLKYNTTWHRAINQTPMLAFRGRNGFNRPTPSQVDSISEDLEPEIEDFVCDFDNIHSASSTETQVVVEEPISIISSVTLDENYRSKYVNRMVNDADVHYFKITFNIGELVLLSKDFDNNTKTRKRKMSDFYEEGKWIIIERVGNDYFKIAKQDNDQLVLVVCENRLKKINI